MKAHAPYNKLRLRRECLHSHGAGPLHKVTLRRGRYGNGIAFSWGGYSEDLPLVSRYRLVATHFSLGKATFSIIHGRIPWNISKYIPLTPGYKWRKAQQLAEAQEGRN